MFSLYFFYKTLKPGAGPLAVSEYNTCNDLKLNLSNVKKVSKRIALHLRN